MAERLKRMGSRLTVDDGFHVPTTLDYFWTETNWFALVIPDRKITIQLYPFFQTNLDVCSAGVYIWDDTGDQWWNCRYAKNFWHLPFPRQPLHDLQLPNGLRYKTLESLQKYAIGFDCPDGEDVHLDIVWEGIVPANRGKSGNHLDQPGRITGTLVLHGETIEINGVGFRDRTWSPRTQFGHGVGPFASMGYTWGTSLTSDDGFFLLSGNVDDTFLEYSLLDGILFHDGVSAKLTEAKRTILGATPRTRALSRCTSTSPTSRVAPPASRAPTSTASSSTSTPASSSGSARPAGPWMASTSSARTKTTGASTTSGATSDPMAPADGADTRRLSQARSECRSPTLSRCAHAAVVRRVAAMPVLIGCHFEPMPAVVAAASHE